ncbi:MAG: DUF2914 domain-containing protein [Desulfomonilia bacterium]|nr:DUF2914 domain-containing protein [Desulfomonilia bacterium]
MRNGVVLFILCSVFLVSSSPASAEDHAGLKVDYGTVSRNVVDLKPVGESTSFPSNVGRLYCFTAIKGAVDPTEIIHVWYHGDQEAARVPLAVKSSLWRTYSSKEIRPTDTGPWKVLITDAQGNKLEIFHFLVFEGQG